MSESNKTVFISYAREDAEFAERLYKDLKNVGLLPWLDKETIRAGENWKIAIRKAIKSSRYFIPLFSVKWVEKAAYVQKEIKYAIDNYDIYPESEISIIPARLDDCQIPFEKLEEIQYVDLFPDWNNGLTKIFDTFRSQGIELTQGGDNQTTAAAEVEEWHLGLSEKDWIDLLSSIYRKK